MAEHKHCLNCGAALHGAYCSHCGQAASTHRFNFHVVFGHDFMHAMFHFGGGFFYTLRQLFTHPGRSVREYVAGKRVKHLNYFSFLIVVVLVFGAVESITDFNYQQVDLNGAADVRRLTEIANDMMKNHPKLLFISILPLLALTTWIMFRKASQNFPEHLVLNTYKQAAVLVLNVFFVLMASRLSAAGVVTAERILSVVSSAYIIWFYHQYFAPYYDNKALLLGRVLMTMVLQFALLIGIILIILVAFPLR